MSRADILQSTLLTVTMVQSIPVLKPRDEDFQKRESMEFSRLVDILAEEKMFSYILDLQDCNYVSSDGLGAVSSSWDRCTRGKQGAMAVVLPKAPGNEVTNLFDITGLSRTIGSAIQPSIKNAVSYLKNFAVL